MMILERLPWSRASLEIRLSEEVKSFSLHNFSQETVWITLEDLSLPDPLKLTVFSMKPQTEKLVDLSFESSILVQTPIKGYSYSKNSLTFYG
jgi:hypothetical protein